MENYDDKKYYDESCIFCKIASGEIETKKVYEDDFVICFNDISPKAHVHVLVLPKAHARDLLSADSFLIEKCFNAIKKLKTILNLEENGFRVISNCGEKGGQTVFHLHFHILSGDLKDF